MCLPTQLERTYTATLLVMVNVMRGGRRAPLTLTSQANFTLMTECTPESSGCYTLCTLWVQYAENKEKVSDQKKVSILSFYGSVRASADKAGGRMKDVGVGMLGM